MKKRLLLVLLFCGTKFIAQTALSQKPQTLTEKVQIYEGTILKAALTKDIRGGDLNVGDQIEFTLADPYIVADRVIIRKGEKIIGSVTDARSSGVLGRKGKLAFSIDYLYLPSGQVIKLRSQNAKNHNGSGVIVAASAVFLTPFALLIPGKGAKFKEGTVFDSFVVETVDIK